MAGHVTGSVAGCQAPTGSHRRGGHGAVVGGRQRQRAALQRAVRSRVAGRRRAKTPKSLPARVGGEVGWPTLYGKTGGRTDHPIEKWSPPNDFRTRERLHACQWAKQGRWFYVEGERQLISGAGSQSILLPCQAGCLSVTGGAQVPQLGLASGTGVIAHLSPWSSPARPVPLLVLGSLSCPVVRRLEG